MKQFIYYSSMSMIGAFISLYFAYHAPLKFCVYIIIISALLWSIFTVILGEILFIQE